MVDNLSSETTPERQVTVALIGAGDRGQVYTSWVRNNPSRARLVAVADPLEFRRDIVAEGFADVAHFNTWQELLAQPQLADMVIVAVQDAQHAEPAIAATKRGYAVLLEKPIAPTEQECIEIVEAIEESNIIFGVCHVLRYTPYTKAIKEILASGLLGEIKDIQHLEPVGWWHQAHSYVRGNWRREADSSSMLLAKSCHDIDWLRYIAGSSITQVASMGELGHFTKANKPATAGSATRCVDCAAATDCPYAAQKIYLEPFTRDGYKWPVSVITKNPTVEGVQQAIDEGPYGRCVYECDNDVVDHQSVLLKFATGATATFTMTAFSEQTHRQTRIFGTHGFLECNGEEIRTVNFRNRETQVSSVGTTGATNAGDGHGGGDAGLMDAFVRAVQSGDPGLITSGARESLESHLAVFAAEKSRRDGTFHSVPAAQSAN